MPHWEPLGSGIEVLVSQRHRFGTDTVLLADFAAPRPTDRAVELGSGCGAIPLLWRRDRAPAHITAVELQPEACALLRQSAARNGLEETIDVVQADLRALSGVLPAGSFHLVVCNPPYKPAGTGIVNPDPSRRLARHEEGCTLAEVAEAAARLLQFGGRFCLCQRPERLCDVLEAFRRAGLEPKRLRFVQQRAAKAPKLFLVEGRRGGKPGGLVTLPTLFLEDASGASSEEMEKIYGSYRGNNKCVEP